MLCRTEVHRTPRRTRGGLAVFVASALCGCSSLLGLDEGAEREPSSRSGESGSSGGASDGSSGNTTSGSSGASGSFSTGSGGSSGSSGPTSSSGGMVSLEGPDCGDLRAYAASPWPMAGACPTRPAAAAVPPLRAPRVRWHYDYPASAYFAGGVSLAADGSVLGVVRLLEAEQSTYYLVGIAADGSRETLRVALPALSAEVSAPTLAADGTAYLRDARSLIAVRAGAVAWSTPLEEGSRQVPLLLPNGTIVTGAKHDVVFVDPVTGAATTKLALGTLASDPVVRDLVLSPTGVIYVLTEQGPGGGAGGKLYALTATGETYFEPQAFDDRPLNPPLFDAAGDVFFANRQSAYSYSPQGTRIWQVSAGNVSFTSLDIVRNRNLVLAPCGSGGCARLFDTASQSTSSLTGLDADVFAAVGAGDGSFVFSLTESRTFEEHVVGYAPDGTLRWTLTVPNVDGGPRSAALGADGAYYSGRGNSLYAIGD